MKNKLISVVITTFGAPVKLERAIESINKQSYKNFEIIVVDDNGEGTKYQKETERIIEKYKFHYLKYVKHKNNKNGSAARNTGIEFSNGEYICFLDNDDVFLPDKFEKSVEYLEEKFEFGGVFSSVLCGAFGKFNERIIIKDTSRLQYGILNGTASIGTGSNLFFRKQVVEDIGKFDERFTRFQDLEYIVRVLDKYLMGYIDEIQIIKDGDGRNVPHYKKMVYNDEMFLDKFKYIIDTYNIEEQNKIYEYHYSERLKYAVNCFGEKNDIDNSINLLLNYRNLTQEEEIMIHNYKYIQFKKRIKSKIKQKEIFKKIFMTMKSLKKDTKFSEYEEYLRY